MMKRFRLSLIVAALSLLATALLPVNAAAVWTPLYAFVGSGSSAQFNSYAYAFASPTGGQYCGAHYWTHSSTLSATGAQIHDGRDGTSIPDEPGKVIIAWDDNAAAGTAGLGTVCALVSLDSTVGSREYFAHATFVLNSASGAATDNTQIPFLTAGEALNANVAAYLQTSPIMTAALADIRPEDTKMVMIRAQNSAGTKLPNYYFTGQGYGPNPLGQPIYSSQGSEAFQSVDFVITPGDLDPFTSAAPRTYVSTSIGAGIVVPIRNNSNAGTGHLGDNTNLSNFNRYGLAQALSGNYSRISDLAPAQGLTAYPLHVWIREPLSGTYNTMEYCIALNREIYSYNSAFTQFGQESNVNPVSCGACPTGPCSSECGNPYYHLGSTFGGGTYTRGRAIGTGEMVTTVNNIADSLGYAYWGYGNFAGKTHVSYSTVDGVDPFWAYPTARTDGGAVYSMPQCSALPCTAIPFPNVVNGSWPIWNYFRLIYDPASNNGNFVIGLINTVTNFAANDGFDFVPASKMQVFRSHYSQETTWSGNGQYPNNGIVPAGNSEAGGDMGGMVLTIQSEIDYYNDTSNQQLQLRQ
jgi:hypothetical protein